VPGGKVFARDRVAVALLCLFGLAAGGRDLRLVDAAKSRDAAQVASLIAQHLPTTISQSDGATALHWAAHWDDLAIANLLIGAGADVNARNQLGVTPLSLACTNASTPMVTALLAHGAHANDALPDGGATALMTCARTGNVTAVAQLVAHGADVNAAETVKGQSALMWAIAENHPDVARLLIEAGANAGAASKRGFTPLLFAAQQGNLASARIVLKAGVDVNAAAPGGSSPLLVAVESGHAEVAEFLVDAGADVNAMAAGRSALHAAVQEARPELVTLLLARGADPNARLKSRLPRVAGELAGGPLSMIGATPFWLAAKFGDVQLMRLLADHGADPLLQSNDKTTPLMVAAGIGWVDGQDRYGRLLFDADLASHEKTDLEAVKLAVALGGDVNAINEHGQTAMHGAAYMGGDSIARFLLERGARLDVVDKEGQTPLVIAEGIYVGGTFVARKSTAALLRAAGAASSASTRP
jgi:ankyrin repeat protein